MNIQYIFIPKNPILWHCADSFASVLTQRKNYRQDTETSVEYVPNVNFKEAWVLTNKLLNSPPELITSLFLLAIQTDYLVLAFLLKLISKFWQRELRVYYLMHEPRIEQERANPIKSFIINAHQVLFAYIADKVMLPSPEALYKAKVFVPVAKIHSVNLAFASIPDEILKQNLQQLKCSWNSCKNFLMLGTVSSIDKNPQGFLDFANAFRQLTPDHAQFIRAGRDRGHFVNYSKFIVQFPTYIPEISKQFLLGLTHFVIVPYTVSTQSGVITEALSHGKLIIVNDIPAFDYLKPFSFTFIVDFSNLDSIRACIHRILTMNISDYEKSYWEAVQYFEQNYSEHCLSIALDQVL